MRKRNIAFAAGIGFVVGYFAKQGTDQLQSFTPEKALTTAKDTFGKLSPISGSWIYMKPESVNKNGLEYTAYHGGVTRNINGENVPYEFYIDVPTGAVIDAYAID